MATGTSQAPDAFSKTENGGSKQPEDNMPNQPSYEQRTSLLCDPCSSADETYEAESFCTECEELLCAACVKAHKRSKLTKTHCLQKTDNMTRNEKDVKENIVYEMCFKHLGRNVEYLCEAHDELCCGDCVQIFHEKCNPILKISDLLDKSFDILNTQEALKQINNVLYKVKEMERRIRVNAYAVNINHSSAVATIKSFRNEIERFFDELKGVAISKRKANNEIIEDLSKASTIISFELTAIRNLINKEKRTVNEKYQQFVSVKRANGSIAECKAKLEALQSKCSIQLYTFLPGEDLEKDIKSKDEFFGKIINTKLKSPEEKIHSFSAPVFSNKGHKIREITVLDRNILVAIFDVAKCLVFINSETRKIITDLLVLDEPRSIAKINEQTLCVLVPTKNKLIYVSFVNGTAKEIQNISINEEYSAICFLEIGEQLVCYNEKKKCVDMLDVSAKMSQTIQLKFDYVPKYYHRKEDNKTVETCIQVIGPTESFDIFLLANETLYLFSNKGKELSRVYQATGFCVDLGNVCYCARDSFIQVHQMHQVHYKTPFSYRSLKMETEFRPEVGKISRIAYCNNTFRLFLLFRQHHTRDACGLRRLHVLISAGN